MRDPKRIDEMLEELGKLWKLRPDMRLGQILSAYLRLGEFDPFYLEDDFLLERIVRARHELSE